MTTTIAAAGPSELPPLLVSGGFPTHLPNFVSLHVDLPQERLALVMSQLDLFLCAGAILQMNRLLGYG